MPERAQLDFAIELAAGQAADPSTLLARSFRVACVDADAAVCARLRLTHKAAMDAGKLRIVNRMPAAASKLRESSAQPTPRPIDWRDLQLLLGTPYYLRLAAPELAPAFLASMAGVGSHPWLISVPCADPLLLTILDRLGYQAVVFTTAPLAPEFDGAEPAPPRHWTSFADARVRHAAEIAGASPATLFCHARR